MSTEECATLSMGADTYKVPLALFAKNRCRLVEKLQKIRDAEKSVVILKGGDEVPLYDTDVCYNNFRQESYFMWCFGVAAEAGCFGIIEVDSGETHLFFPRFPEEYAVWMGPLHTLEHFSKKYRIAKIHYVDEIVDVLKTINPSKLLTLKGVNTDSGFTAKPANFEGIHQFKLDNEILFPVIAELRVYKTPEELEVLKYVVRISSAAHRAVMRFIKNATTEYQCESHFLDYCYKIGGCRHVSYTCICGSGPNGAILHYGHAGAPNDRCLKETDICLFDMGANYFGYAADITCSFPKSGKFTPDQKLIYEAVLAANRAVMKAAKPGVKWPDMHLLSLQVMLEQLKKGGLLQGDVQEMIKAGVGYVLQPHGLGHLMGLDVHDVGGYLEGQPKRRDDILGLNKLRTARVLQEGMVLTIEPGCYFIENNLKKALADPKTSKFFVPEVLKRFYNFGGIRIEDDVYVTANGIMDLTIVPRTVQEIEDWMAGKDDDEY